MEEPTEVLGASDTLLDPFITPRRNWRIWR